ncbi:hypothetical protein HHL16_18735 [Pseudoflavitalea sp. G-6-1-2]|uniref:hypothetical protein n=1 Tax=Pseudoflavitalea sp. G-6-1-2 TaxID=2728841 RepID=UPI00146DAEC6|nr:hypothetical protein [Pseudoflavitalea sp. G-6-1-2]NML22921.1 hypothetical protein [Pseudoflavitalea sp. G-6-1-2]
MKKLFILMTISFAGLATNAQTTQITKRELTHEKRELPSFSYQANEQFLNDFDNVSNVVWRHDSYFDIVSFTKDGISQTAYYDASATLVGTCFDKTFADLPQSAQNYINKKYAGYTKGPIMLFDDNEANETNMSLYGTQFEDEDNYFIELKKGNEDFVLRITPLGGIFWFKTIRS